MQTMNVVPDAPKASGYPQTPPYPNSQSSASSYPSVLPNLQNGSQPSLYNVSYGQPVSGPPSQPASYRYNPSDQPSYLQPGGQTGYKQPPMQPPMQSQGGSNELHGKVRIQKLNFHHYIGSRFV
jgi:hypothetical protein